jgi:hypothetical protein
MPFVVGLRCSSRVAKVVMPFGMELPFDLPG